VDVINSGSLVYVTLDGLPSGMSVNVFRRFSGISVACIKKYERKIV